MWYSGKCFNTLFLPIQQWLLLAPDRPCAQHVQSTRRMSLTVKRPSIKGLPFQLMTPLVALADSSPTLILDLLLFLVVYMFISPAFTSERGGKGYCVQGG
jgi:hypothetical protein